MSCSGVASGVMGGPSREGEGLSPSYVWLKGAAAQRRLGGIHVTPAMKRGILSWLRSTCSALERELRNWLSSVWQRRRNPGSRWSRRSLGLASEAQTGLRVSCVALAPLWLGKPFLLLLMPPTSSLNAISVATGRGSATANPTPDLPGFLGMRSAGPMGKEMWIFPVETGRGLRRRGRGLLLFSNARRWV